MIKKYFILFAVCILVFGGVFARLYQFNTLPGIHVDELAFGYSAYSLGIDLRDEYGKFLPIILQSFGDNKLALYAYVLLPFVKLFGLSESVIRVPNVLMGFLSIVLIFFYIKKLIQNKIIAAITAILVLISPWHIIFSRTANESLAEVFFILAFFLCWYKYLETGKKVAALLTIILLIAGFLSYYSSFIFIPLLSVIFIIIFKHFPFRRRIIPLLALIPIIIIFVRSQSLSRINQTSVFSHGGIQAEISQRLQEEGRGTNTIKSRLFNNKLLVSSENVLENYSRYLTFDFLFFKGDENYGRYSIPFMGLLYLWELPFLIMGLYVCVKNALRKSGEGYLLILFWILIAFIPPSLSFMGTNSQRTLIVFPMFHAVIALGIYSFYQLLSTKPFYLKVTISCIFSFVVIYNYFYFINNYFVHQKVHQPWNRDEYGKDMIQTINQLSPNYKKTVISESSTILFLFYNKINPLEAREILANRESDSLGFYHFKSFRDYIFMPPGCPGVGKLDVLYVCSGTKVAYNTNILKVIRFGDGQPARIFLTFIDPTLNKPPPNIDNVSIYPDTKLNPKIIPESENRYW